MLYNEVPNAFLLEKKLNNYSEASLLLYKSSIKVFIKFLEKKYGIFNWKDVSTKELRSFIAYLMKLRNKRNGKLLAETTRSLMLTQTKNFCTWLIEENYLHADTQPFGEVKFHTRLFSARVLSEPEIKMIFSVINTDTFTGFRDRSIFETLYSCGLRKRELIRLDLYDLDFEQKTIFIRQSKGKKDRIVPMGKTLEGYLSEYISKVRPSFLIGNMDNTSLFITNKGEPYTPRAFALFVEKYSAKSNVSFSAHTWRHTFATHMLKYGASIVYIQQILGHSDLSTTERYTHLYPTDIKNIIQELHPRSRKELAEEEIVLPNRRRIHNIDEAILRTQHPTLAKVIDSVDGRKMIGDRMRAYRKDAGISQSKLAKESGVSAKTIQRMERGLGAEFESWVKIIDLLPDV